MFPSNFRRGEKRKRERERVALFTSLVYDLFMSDAAMLIFTSVEKEAKNQ